jgi:HAD superfamily hydrolase (TIGR01484 family)
MDIKKKKLVVFDLDGTLAPSKSPMEPSMCDLFHELLEYRQVAIIGGGKYELFKFQFLDQIDYSDNLLKKVHLFPNTASRMYEYVDEKWQSVYGDDLTVGEVSKIKLAFEQAFKDIGWQHPSELYGEQIEDRGTQVSFSVYGQTAPLALKHAYQGSSEDRRIELKKVLDKYLSEFEVRVAGTTTVDVTRKGIDKAYGLKQIEKRLEVSISDMVFVGDALFEGGNDEAVKKTGVDTIEVKNSKDTEKIIMSWLEDLKK